MSSFKKILLYIYAFFIIFLPSFEFINPLLGSGFISLLLATFNVFLLNKKLFYLMKKADLFKIIIIYIIITIYIIVLNLLNNFNISNFLNGFSFGLYLINFTALVIWFKKIYFREVGKDIIDFIINVGLIQVVIMILMIINPTLKEIANLLYSQNEILSEHLSYVVSYRVYGIGNSYTFMLPLTLGIISILALYKFDQTLKIRYLLYSFLIILTSSFNGRTALLIYIFIILGYFIKWSTQFNIKKNTLLVVVLIFLFIFFILSYSRVENIYNWIIVGVEDVFVFLFYGEADGNINALTTSHLFFPNGLIEFLFGTGQRTFGNSGLNFYGQSSDIGYINDLFKGGIVYLITLYTLHFKYIIDNIDSFSLKLALIFYVILANYKGEIMTNGIVLLLVYLMIINNKFDILSNTSLDLNGV